MDIAYGIKIQESGDRYISLAEEVMNASNEVSTPGAFGYVPSWLPGAGFQKKAAYWRKLSESTVENPFCYVQVRLVGEPFSRIMNLFIL